MVNLLPSSPLAPPSIEMWGAVDGTRNRIGDEYYDQLERSGHDRREADLDLFASLGLRTLRYPCLWERIAPEGPRWADWTWPDARLGRLQALGIRPIVGFVQGGSGPTDLSPLDPGFPTRLAAFARAFAERYPWVDAYTPIDAPMLTARRCGLEGHWYPHGRDDRTFARAMMVQCRATALVMRAVREINPHAKLVQTEYVGHTRGTPALAHRVDFENDRRWLTFDLLAGRVVPGHPMYGYLVRARVGPAELNRFVDRPCPPDLVGLTYDVAAERFLDDRVDLYPAAARTEAGGREYADVEAVRACPEGLRGAARLLGEASQRYGAPLALAGTHLASTPDERLRWLVHVWREARAARARGADVRAVTAGALLGVHGRAPLFADDGHYEPGAFTAIKGEPRPTIVTEGIAALAAGFEPEHRVLARPGWWQRPERLCYRPAAPPPFEP
ncbi:MAG TPA: dTDP-4-dehydrorhamnose reductase, partial [Polyangiaceae bacterium]|nr:dTDP-4-dehydrorhamnose reductase [Polyangiaceae bacterium]